VEVLACLRKAVVEETGCKASCDRKRRREPKLSVEMGRSFRENRSDKGLLRFDSEDLDDRGEKRGVDLLRESEDCLTPLPNLTAETVRRLLASSGSGGSGPVGAGRGELGL